MEPTKVLFVSADAAPNGDVAWQVHREAPGTDERRDDTRDGSDDGGDVVDVLEAYEKAWGHCRGFQLQRKVEGVEVAVCGSFDGNRFVEPVNSVCEQYFRDLLCNSARCIERQSEITAA